MSQPCNVQGDAIIQEDITLGCSTRVKSHQQGEILSSTLLCIESRVLEGQDGATSDVDLPEGEERQG